MSGRRSWGPIVERARAIVESYDTPVTLRQLFYRLVAAQVLRNTQADYTHLSHRTAEARRSGDFPDLIDNTRKIRRPAFWDGPRDALQALVTQYRRDRTEGQENVVYLGVEKAGMVAQLDLWFSDRGLPILPLGGYSSQTFTADVAKDIKRQGRPAVLIYAGDFDPSGEDIPRDFAERVRCFDVVERIALTPEQVDEYELPVAMGKETDSRARSFAARHGRLVQVELDALAPDVLRHLYEDALARFLDTSTMNDAIHREREDRAALARLQEELGA